MANFINYVSGVDTYVLREVNSMLEKNKLPRLNLKKEGGAPFDGEDTVFLIDLEGFAIPHELKGSKMKYENCNLVHIVGKDASTFEDGYFYVQYQVRNNNANEVFQVVNSWVNPELKNGNR